MYEKVKLNSIELLLPTSFLCLTVVMAYISYCVQDSAVMKIAKIVTNFSPPIITVAPHIIQEFMLHSWVTTQTPALTGE